MTTTIKVLDLCCKAGGMSMGFHLAGLDVTGVDIEPQPHYPFPFIQAEGVDFVLKHGHEYGLISCSPPCQEYSQSTKQWKMKGKTYPALIPDFREALQAVGSPYIIENVPGAPLLDPVFLNGAMFGLYVHRPRFFECSFPVQLMMMPKVPPAVKMGRNVERGQYIQPIGHFSSVSYAREQMQINWMNRGEMAEAIPPAYSKYLAQEWLKTIYT